MLTTFDVRRRAMAPVLMICLLGAGTDQLLAQGVTTTIVLTDDAVPEGNGDFSTFGRPVLNGAGQAAFLAIYENCCVNRHFLGFRVAVSPGAIRP